jgi:hypothetical protein
MEDNPVEVIATPVSLSSSRELFDRSMEIACGHVTVQVPRPDRPDESR